MSYISLIKLGLPITISSLSYVATEQIDTIFIAPLGSVSLGAVALASNMAALIYVTGRGFGIGQSHLIAKFRGAGHPDQAMLVFKNALSIRLLYALLTSLIMTQIANHFPLLGINPEITVACNSIIIYFAIGSFLSTIQGAFRDLAESFEDAKTPLIIVYSGILLRGFVLYIFIYQNRSASYGGIKACGLAYIVGQAFTLICLMIQCQRKFKWLGPIDQPSLLTEKFQSHVTEGTYSRTPDHGNFFGEITWARSLKVSYFELSIMKQMLVMSAPFCLQLFCEVAAFFATGLMTAKMTPDDLAARQIAHSISTLTFMIPLGISQAALILISKERGQGRIIEAAVYTRKSLILTWVSMSILGLFIFLTKEQIGSAYQLSAGAFNVLMPMLIITAIFQLSDGTQCVAGSLLRAWDDAKVPALLSIMSWWIIAIPLSAALGFGLKAGAVGIWAGLACGVVTASILLLLRLKVIIPQRGVRNLHKFSA